jgi:hypothetical protein
MRNVWRPVQLRSILYVAAAGGGIVLANMSSTQTSEDCHQVAAGFDCFTLTKTSKSNQGLGYGLVAAAAVAFAVDAFTTSRRASSLATASAPTDRSRVELLRLAVIPSPSTRAARVELVRIKL